MIADHSRTNCRLFLFAVLAVATGCSLENPNLTVAALAYARDGSLTVFGFEQGMATIDRDMNLGSVVAYDIERGSMRLEATSADHTVAALTLEAYAGQNDPNQPRLGVYRLADGRRGRDLVTGYADDGGGVALSDDGSIAVVSVQPATVAYRVADGAELWRSDWLALIRAVPGANALIGVAVGNMLQLRVLDAASGAVRQSVDLQPASHSGVLGLTVSLDGSFAAVGVGDPVPIDGNWSYDTSGHYVVFRLSDGSVVRQIGPLQNPGLNIDLSLSSDGRFLASEILAPSRGDSDPSNYGAVTVWDGDAIAFRVGVQWGSLDPNPRGGRVALSPDGSRLALTYDAETVRFHDVPAGKLVRAVTVPTNML